LTDGGRAEPGRRDEVRVTVFGLGGVGLALLELMTRRAASLRLSGVADSHGAMAGELDPAVVLDMKQKGPIPAAVPRADVLNSTRPDVVVDVMSCDFGTAEPSLSVILAGFSAGSHVVTANKAPLARFWREIFTAAATTRRHLAYAGAAGASLPAVAVARTLSRTDEVDSFEGVLTGTTTFILEQMAAGLSLDDAVRGAQARGISEPDPSIDVGGLDTAAKVIILANTLWGMELNIKDVQLTGLHEDMEVSREGRKVRLVGRAERNGKDVKLEVAPSLLDVDHPLASLRGSDKGVVFSGPAIGRVLVSGGRSSPRAAAGAVLGDILELAECSDDSAQRATDARVGG
jgi:homoserine dehydrogenase